MHPLICHADVLWVLTHAPLPHANAQVLKPMHLAVAALKLEQLSRWGSLGLLPL